MDKIVSRWAAGMAYGPILSQTDLYLLQTELELNPILEGKADHLQFHLVTGFTSNGRGGESAFVGKDEPATMPRVNQLIIVSRLSPWCTIIKKETGVTIGDLCSAIFKDYTEHDITDAEFNALPPRLQETLKRQASSNYAQTHQPAAGSWAAYYTPHVAPERLRRVDWLRERVFFEGLSRDDSYVKSRLGFRAANVFIMDLTS